MNLFSRRIGRPRAFPVTFSERPSSSLAGPKAPDASARQHGTIWTCTCWECLRSSETVFRHDVQPVAPNPNMQAGAATSKVVR